MKQVDKLLTDVFQAYYDARKNKRNTKSQIEFEMNLEENLISLYEQVRDFTYVPGPSICFMVNHPVKREVFASGFRDRVIHHLLYNYIAPAFERRFIYDSYSCRTGKGTLMGINRLEHHIRSCTNNYSKDAYILKLDIQGYFMNIDKLILRGMIIKTLEREWSKKAVAYSKEIVLYLIDKIIFKDATQGCKIRGSRTEWKGLPASKSLFNTPKMIGLPIGDLTSQLFSNIYLNSFDHFVKRELKMKHYGRYVDDFFIVHEDKYLLKELISKMDSYLRDNLGLCLHPKKMYLQHYTKGIHFLGSMIKPYRRYVIDRSVKSYNKSLNQISRLCKGEIKSLKTLCLILSRINSYLGHFGNFKSLNIRKRTLVRNLPIFRYFCYQGACTKVLLLRRYKQRNVSCEKFLTDILAEVTD